MRVLRHLLLAATLVVTPSLAVADTVFTDGFSTATPAFGVSSAGHFNAQSGTNVDILGPGFYNLGPAHPVGNICTTAAICVDLSGFYSYGILQSDIEFQPGVYDLDFRVTGTRRFTVASILNVQLGNYSQTFNLAAFDTLHVNRLVTVTTPSSLTFWDQDGPGTDRYAGPLLNIVTVSHAPEPSSLVLMGSGLLSGLGMLARRRRA